MSTTDTQSAEQPKKDLTQSALSSVVTATEAWSRIYPRLHAHLTQGRHEDRSLRITSTLLMFLEDGRMKLALHDRDQHQIAFLTVPALPEGFALLERKLSENTLEWKPKKEFRKVYGQSS